MFPEREWHIKNIMRRTQRKAEACGIYLSHIRMVHIAESQMRDRSCTFNADYLRENYSPLVIQQLRKDPAYGTSRGMARDMIAWRAKFY
jgi:hypothetical protein